MPVYFIQRDSDKAIKIGKSVNVRRRFSMLKQQYRNDILVPLGVINGYSEKEKELHNRFAATRLAGEWFTNSNGLLGFIAKYASGFDSRVANTSGRATGIFSNHPVKVTILEYLDRLKVEQESLPVDRRTRIPAIRDFVKFLDVKQQAFYDLVKNNTPLIDRVMIRESITLLRLHGFDTDIPDVIQYHQKEPNQ